MNISIKLKFLLLLLVIPFVGFLSYGYMTKKTFENDKIAFVFSTTEKEADFLKTRTQSLVKYWAFITQSALDQINWMGSQKFPPSIIPTLSSLEELKLYKVYKSNNGNKKSVEFFNKNNSAQENKLWSNKLNEEVKIFESSKRNFLISSLDSARHLFILFQKIPSDVKNELFFSLQIIASEELSRSFMDPSVAAGYILDTSGRTVLGALNQSSMDFTQSNLVNYFKQKVGAGSTTITVNGKSFLGAYSFLDQDLYIVSLMEEEKVLAAIGVLNKQTQLFLIIALGSSIILSFLFSNRLTKAIRELSEATVEIGKGNYNLTFNIKSKDEVEVLSTSFSSMAKKIQQLLIELKKYSDHLEQLVEERTAKLNSAMKMQKAILESLGQGFLIFDKANKIQPIYSQAAVQMFNGEPTDKNFWSLISKDAQTQKECEDLFGSVFDQMMPFEDMKPYAPNFFINHQKSYIEFDYHPIENEQKTLSGVIVVATDKTKEIESMKALEVEKAHMKMIQKALSQKYHFERFLKDFMHILSKTKSMVESHRQEDLPDILRYLHTLKGNSSLYSLVELKNQLHQLEMRVKDQTKSQSLDWTMLHQDLSLLMDSFEKFLKEHREMLGLKLSDDESMLELSYPMMSKLYEKLKPQITSDLSFEIAHSWFYNPISEYLKVFPSYVEELSERLSKKIFPLKFNGDQLKIKRGYYDDLFLSLIHLIRNATDHGIESPEERVGKGKLAHGQIQFNFKEEGRDSSHTLIIEIEDDGKGLDLEKILKNDFVKLNPEQQELAVIKKLFYEGISTKTEVTDISGQGAGLAAVGLVMTKLKGKISIDLNKKVGTKFILKVPYV